MELAEPEFVALSVFIAPEQIHDLPFANDVADFLVRTRCRARRFTFGRFAIQTACVHEILYCLLECPSAGVQIHIHTDAGAASPSADSRSRPPATMKYF